MHARTDSFRITSQTGTYKQATSLSETRAQAQGLHGPFQNLLAAELKFIFSGSLLDCLPGISRGTAWLCSGAS